jgi:hypothetical protein
MLAKSNAVANAKVPVAPADAQFQLLTTLQGPTQQIVPTKLNWTQLNGYLA